MASPGAVVRKRGKMKGRQRVFRLHRCLHVSVISVVASPRLRRRIPSSPSSHLLVSVTPPLSLSLSSSVARRSCVGGGGSEAYKAQEACEFLPCHRFSYVRAGMEMAMIDAASKSVGVPLWKLFVVLKRNLSA
ncbi:hypothetical protein F2Q69_00003277 [Brassica cretica]|uniref:Uncharacterized protein n=1 Tax=Brassica cretica TaxID=69181 RepID=A0A8S9P672_BRACR|nr:hypothetical protein F2Q69_00003277 [Brassica cretica]